MILDEYSELADAFALNTGAPGMYTFGDAINLGAVSPGDLGPSDQYLVIQIDTAVTSAGAATVQFSVVSDAQGSIATDGSATVHATTGAIPKALLVAGYLIAMKLPRGVYERYLGILQTTGTAALTGGKANVFLTHDVSQWKAFADNVA